MRMRSDLLPIITLAMAVACGGTAAGPARMPSEPAGLPAGPAVEGHLASPPPLPPTQTGIDPLPCGYEPPPIWSPTDGAVVRGKVALTSPLVEGPCFITASIVFMVADASGNLVRRGCSWDLPATIPWNTTEVPNGQYWVTAQRACSCNACAEFSYVGVTVAN